MESETLQIDKVASTLREARLAPLPLIPALSKELPYKSTPSKDESAVAHSLLVDQRKSDAAYKPPEEKKRYLFKYKRWKKQEANVDTWVFSQHEVAKVFHSLLLNVPLPSPGLARALLSRSPLTRIDELSCHLHDKKSEEKISKHFSIRTSSSESISDPQWLMRVPKLNYHEYMRLICQTGVAQEELNAAFGVALLNRSIEAMTILLREGAIASAYQETIRDYVKRDDSEVINLLLSSPSSMSIEAWRQSLEPQFQMTSSKILLQCLVNRPSIVCGSLLLQSLMAGNFTSTAIILAYAPQASDEYFLNVFPTVCDLLSRIGSDEIRLKFIRIFGSTGYLKDALILRKELIEGVKHRQISLVQILVDAGVSVDIEPNQAVRVAVVRMDLEMLRVLTKAKLTSPISPLFDFVPEESSESDLLELFEIFKKMPLAGQPLDVQLVRAVQKQQTNLVEVLLIHGASIEYQKASAIRAVLKHSNTALLETLLKHECSADILSVAVPDAMAIKPRSVRLKAMQQLAKKGVKAQELGMPLQTLAAESDPIDFDLVNLILQQNAPIDGVGDERNNAVFLATRRGSVALLSCICDAKPSKQTLSDALPMAFDAAHTHTYDIGVDMIQLLLRHGVTHDSVNQLLIKAVKQDKQLRIVKILVENGADANYSSATCFGVAVRAANFELVKLLCTGRPPSSITTKFLLSLATNPLFFNLKVLDLLLRSTPAVNTVLNTVSAVRYLKGNLNVVQIVGCFLRHGMDVNLSNGDLLCFAVDNLNNDLLGVLLLAKPNLVSLKAAFQKTTSIKDRHLKLLLQGSLLQSAASVQIGQSAELILETDFAIDDDTLIFELLLAHEADVDFANGKAVQKAAIAGSLKTLKILLDHHPSLPTVQCACVAVASSTLMDSDRKQAVFQDLLDLSATVTIEGLSEILTACVTTLPDHSQLPEMLLARGAKVDLEMLKVASITSTQALFISLANNVMKPSMMLYLFRFTRDQKMIYSRKYWLYEHLLHQNITRDDVSEALLQAVRFIYSDYFPIVTLLLDHGASLRYKNGAALKIAFKLRLVKIVDILRKYVTDDQTADLAFRLARRDTSMDSPIRFGIYECLLTWQIEASNVEAALRETLQDRSQDSDIVGLLLKYGVDPNKDDARCFVLASAKESEEKLRALSRPWSVPIGENYDPSLSGLGARALPAFSTPSARLSAAFVCVLDDDRTDILKALLSLDRVGVMQHTMLESKFACLATYPKTNDDPGLEDSTNELDLQIASIYTGNFRAFELISAWKKPAEGTLHMAAILALPKFVSWLLENGHDPNLRTVETGPLIPLALVCQAKYVATCTVANKEAKLTSRQTAVMHLLAAKTDLTWKYRHMTVLHYALQEGPDVAAKMLVALGVETDEERDEKYLYIDRDGIHYSPDKYVEKLMGDSPEKGLLIAISKVFHLTPRYYMDVEPGKGKQPDGYTGLPSRLQLLWQRHEAEW